MIDILAKKEKKIKTNSFIVWITINAFFVKQATVYSNKNLDLKKESSTT